MRRLSILSLGTALVFALGACSSGTASSSNNSSPQSSHVAASASSSNASSAGQQIEVLNSWSTRKGTGTLILCGTLSFQSPAPSHESGKTRILKKLKKKGISEKEIDAD